MAERNSYVTEVLRGVEERYKNEPEFVQAVTEVFDSIEPIVAKNEEIYRKNAILERITEPDRIISFRVSWQDDKGKINVNRGYRVQFNNAIGPYKGGLRFHPSVNQSILKFLGFEQIFKNSLTTLAMGGGKGGSDFDPRGKSDAEIMRFCQSFMTELFRHIGSDVDVPAGDIGVGGREIGYMFGQYKRLKNAFDNGVLTGKDLSFGGSYIRPEATGYGAVYFLEEVLKDRGESIKGKTFALSGYGNVTWGVCKKLESLGGKVISISGSQGYIYDKDGVAGDKVDYLLKMRSDTSLGIKAYADKFGAEFHPNEKPWGKFKADICMPCATQNEILLSDAEELVKSGVKIVCECSNMPTTIQAAKYLEEHGVLVCPAKAVNAGGVAVSGLEMAQNGMRLSWTADEVDSKLKSIMREIYAQIKSAIEEFSLPYNLIQGANIAGFKKVANAMTLEGVY